MQTKHIILLIILVSAIIVLYSAAFVVRQTEQALVLEFGKPVRMVTKPGLNFKLPLAQNVLFFDNRVIDIRAAQPREVLSSDKKRLIIDSFAKYRIVDALQFYQTVRNEAGMAARLNTILESRLKAVIRTEEFKDLLSAERRGVMARIHESVKQEAKSFGVEVIDVRIMRADLPKEISEAVFSRMQTERQQEAANLRSEGEADARRIRSEADKTRTEILANAQKQAEITRGEGDGVAAKIYADAYTRDAQFYEFYRSMQAYRASLKKEDTRVILTPKNQFLKYFD